MFMNFPFDYFSKAIIPIEMETVGDDTILKNNTDNEIRVVYEENVYLQGFYLC